LRLSLKQREYIGGHQVPVSARDLHLELIRKPPGVAHVELQMAPALFLLQKAFEHFLVAREVDVRHHFLGVRRRFLVGRE
jgi:hypothetical protein